MRVVGESEGEPREEFEVFQKGKLPYLSPSLTPSQQLKAE